MYASSVTRNLQKQDTEIVCPYWVNVGGKITNKCNALVTSRKKKKRKTYM